MSFGAGRDGLDGFSDPLDDLGRALDGVLGLDPVALPASELQADLLRWSRRRDREDAGFAAWVLAAVRNGVGVADGYVDTIGWLSWKTGKSRGELRKLLRWAELAELLPETGQAWRDGRITTSAVELIASARVEGCDAELAAMEPEFLDRAMRGDHKSLKMLTQHFRACARADGSKPDPADTFTVAEVGDRYIGRFDVAKSSAQTLRDAMTTFTRPPVANDDTTLAARQAEGLIRIAEIALQRGPDANGARPVVSYLTQAVGDDAVAPMMLGVFSGVIDPRERERILCDADIVPVTTDHRGQILDQGRATPVWNRATRRALTHRSPHCQWPGCETPAPWCDAHHFHHWEQGGPTSLANGVHLCRRHHVFLHQHRDWHSTFDHQQFRVFRRRRHRSPPPRLARTAPARHALGRLTRRRAGRETGVVNAGVDPLLHLIGAGSWRVALDAGSVVDASLVRDGFLHLSGPDQVALAGRPAVPGAPGPAGVGRRPGAAARRGAMGAGRAERPVVDALPPSVRPAAGGGGDERPALPARVGRPLLAAGRRSQRRRCVRPGVRVRAGPGRTAGRGGPPGRRWGGVRRPAGAGVVGAQLVVDHRRARRGGHRRRGRPRPCRLWPPRVVMDRPPPAELGWDVEELRIQALDPTAPDPPVRVGRVHAVTQETMAGLWAPGWRRTSPGSPTPRSATSCAESRSPTHTRASSTSRCSGRTVCPWPGPSCASTARRPRSRR